MLPAIGCRVDAPPLIASDQLSSRLPSYKLDAPRGIRDRLPLLRDAPKRVTRVKELESKVRERCGVSLREIQSSDVVKDQEIQRGIGTLGLSELFDDRGSPCCRKLGLACMARLTAKEDIVWGSNVKMTQPSKTEYKARSAKSLMKSQEALQRDLDLTKARSVKEFMELRDEDRLKVDEVSFRRVEVVFNEVPDFEKYLPGGIEFADVQPEEVERDIEQKDRVNFERANLLARQGRILVHLFVPQNTLGAFVRVALLWTATARPSIATLGMDRPTFCQCILDIGLVDFVTVPFFWAVSLFDALSRPMFCDPSAAQGSPVVQVVCVYHLVGIFDMLLRTRFSSMADIRRYLVTVVGVARSCLPDFVFETFGLRNADIDELNEKSSVQTREAKSIVSTKWHVSSMKAANSSQDALDDQKKLLGREELSRDYLVYALMVEPEVLHLTMQHFEAFRHLYKCYADMTGVMTFEMFLQFCHDFRLAPTITSSHFAHRVFENARCLDFPSDSFDKPATPSTQTYTPAPPASPSWRKSLAMPRRATAATPPGKRAGTFGVAAFVECLFRIAFSHLECRGNQQQRSTGGFERTVWLLGYLRCVFASLRASLDKRSGDSTQFELHRSLLLVLQGMSPATWDSPAAPSKGLLVRPTLVRPEMPDMKLPFYGDNDMRLNTQPKKKFTLVSLRRKVRCERGNLESKEITSRPSDLSPFGDQAPTRGSPLCSTRGRAGARRLSLRDEPPQQSLDVTKLSAKVAPRRPSLIRDASERWTGARETQRVGSGGPSVSTDDFQNVVEAVPAPSKSESRCPSGASPFSRTDIEACDEQLPLASRWSMVGAASRDGGPAENEPWINGGTCHRCRMPVGPSSWGRATCLGCSIVDSMVAERHPFSALLSGCRQRLSEPLLPPAKTKAFFVHEVPLTPPRLLGSNALRFAPM